jgi:cation:H+ antiporter
MILEAVVSVVVGLALLFLGGEWLVKAASRLALSFGVSALMIGGTVVALGTSMPELLVSAVAAISGNSDIALGNVVGSNITNISLLLGLTAMIAPLVIHSSFIRREVPIMIGVAILGLLLSLDGEIGRLDGLLLVGGYGAFGVFSYRVARRDRELEQEFETFEAEEHNVPPVKRPREAGQLVISIVFLALGAQWLVDGSVTIARTLGVTDLVIGLTLVALGTSMPELATSIIAAIRGERDIAVGNMVGSNIANILVILGVTAIIRPISVAPQVVQIDYPVMLAFSGALLLIVLDGRMRRWEGAAAVIAYIAFVVYLFVRNAG